MKKSPFSTSRCKKGTKSQVHFLSGFNSGSFSSKFFWRAAAAAAQVQSEIVVGTCQEGRRTRRKNGKPGKNTDRKRQLREREKRLNGMERKKRMVGKKGKRRKKRMER